MNKIYIVIYNEGKWINSRRIRGYFNKKSLHRFLIDNAYSWSYFQVFYVKFNCFEEYLIPINVSNIIAEKRGN